MNIDRQRPREASRRDDPLSFHFVVDVIDGGIHGCCQEQAHESLRNRLLISGKWVLGTCEHDNNEDDGDSIDSQATPELGKRRH